MRYIESSAELTLPRQVATSVLESKGTNTAVSASAVACGTGAGVPHADAPKRRPQHHAAP
jgi:hypothetical protein